MAKGKVLYTIIRILLGLVFVVFGIIKFFPAPPETIPTGVAGEFLAGLTASGYFIYFLAICEVILGLMFLFNRWAALASVMLMPISINIFLFDAILKPTGYWSGFIPIILNLYMIHYHFDKYKPLLAVK